VRTPPTRSALRCKYERQYYWRRTRRCGAWHVRITEVLADRDAYVQEGHRLLDGDFELLARDVRQRWRT